MDIRIIDFLVARVPGLQLKPFPHQTDGHTHEETHITVVWGAHLLEESEPVLAIDGKSQARDAQGKPMWRRLPDVEISGKGPDSLIRVPAGNLHNLIALEPGCYHACLFLHMGSDGKPRRKFFGRLRGIV